MSTSARPVTASAALGLAYVSLVSMCLGFFAWYQAMARGGVARIGRLQLAQPALTLLWSVLLLGEHVGLLSGTAAVAVIAVTAVGRNARVDTATAGRQLEPSQAAHSRSPAWPAAGPPLGGQAPATFMANTDPAASVSSSRSR